MPGVWRNPDVVAPEPQRTFTVVEDIDRRLRLDLEAERQALLDDAPIEKIVVRVQPDRRGERALARPTPVMWSRCAWVSRM